MSDREYRPGDLVAINFLGDWRPGKVIGETGGRVHCKIYLPRIVAPTGIFYRNEIRPRSGGRSFV